MKKLFTAAMDRPIKAVVNTQLNSTWNANPFLYLALLCTAFLLTTCKKIAWVWKNNLFGIFKMDDTSIIVK